MTTILKTCPKCNSEFNAQSKWGLKKFCSRSCANSRGPRTDDFKDKVRTQLTGRTRDIPNATKGKRFVEYLTKQCLCCGIEFSTRETEDRKYCSNDCWRQQSGGYREGSGRSKSGYYKGIYCGSTYELCWVIYNLDHNIPFTRFSGYLEKDGLKYYPDFLIDNTIIEIKGYENVELVNKKTALAESFGYSVIVLRKEQLENEFRYVSNTYSSNFKTLYDGYKPTYDYICNCCSTKFSRDKKLKTDVVFCSRTCAGKGHTGRVT
jgi:hypothetical protein